MGEPLIFKDGGLWATLGKRGDLRLMMRTRKLKIILPPLASYGVKVEHAASQNISPFQGIQRVDLAGDSCRSEFGDPRISGERKVKRYISPHVNG
jgi:hypothetical protein